MGTETDNLALARRALSHLDTKFSRRESNILQPLFDSFSEDAVFWVPCEPNTPRYGEPARGKQQIIDLFMSDPDFFEGVDIERPVEFIGDGDRIVATFALRYTIRRTGASYRGKEVALIMDFKDGQIVRMTEIQDMSAWSQAYPADAGMLAN
ncbi:Ketosteroid isomerase-related protein [Prauserella marina]|uniref:Ketosteroid isomerase-related protein n=2 Tax=Prauserella marina TaxID=530584 RepID=A0A1G6UMF0_9PSEU|nr:ketosteroid isomerase-like protein [Prauserella marina]SDD41747.1 Ketosteroid isomerase-related protein [Prauserella marina]